MALTPEKQACPSVRASALRLSRLHLLTSWDCPSSLSGPLCQAKETGPFLPSLQHLLVGWWEQAPRTFPAASRMSQDPFLCRPSPLPLAGPTGGSGGCAGPPTRQSGDTFCSLLLWLPLTLWAGPHSTSHTCLTDTDRQPDARHCCWCQGEGQSLP